MSRNGILPQSSGQALGHFHFMDEPVRRAGQAAHSRRGAAHAANIAKLAGVATDLYRPTSAMTSTPDISPDCAH